MNVNIRAQSLIPVCVLASLAWLPASASVIEEVVVTAQKRAQSVQDVGIAVTRHTPATNSRRWVTTMRSKSPHKPQG